MANNIFINSFFENFIAAFRRQYSDKLVVTIYGLGYFAQKNNLEIDYLKQQFALYDIDIQLSGYVETVDNIEVDCVSLSSGKTLANTTLRVQDTTELIVQSSRTDVPLVCLIILKAIALIITNIKILYKAIVLDLDDTLWSGTLSEIGIDNIKVNMMSDMGNPFINFMKFLKSLAEEFGIYIAICSRNNSDDVEEAIKGLDDDIFPIKKCIDYIVANHNDKSANIKLIAQELSILPSAIVFVDDNSIVRNEVRKNLPGVFVPEWNNHDELTSIITITSCFDRNLLSLNYQRRREQFKVLRAERLRNNLPELFVEVKNDVNHTQAKELYRKSNQFKLVSEQIDYENAKSFFFEIYRSNGESLGVCSTLTLSMVDNTTCSILNWAISCRYFEIGLEEFILIFLIEEMNIRNLYFACQCEDRNCKVHEFIGKYYGRILLDSCDSVPSDDDISINYYNFDEDFKRLLLRLKNNNHRFDIYSITDGINEINEIRSNTNLKRLL